MAPWGRTALPVQQRCCMNPGCFHSLDFLTHNSWLPTAATLGALGEPALLCSVLPGEGSQQHPWQQCSHGMPGLGVVLQQGSFANSPSRCFHRALGQSDKPVPCVHFLLRYLLGIIPIFPPHCWLSRPAPSSGAHCPAEGCPGTIPAKQSPALLLPEQMADSLGTLGNTSENERFQPTA